MRAVRWHGRRDVRLDGVPEPRPTARDLVVEVEYCGVCGTDLEEYLEGPVNVPVARHPLSGASAPMTLGHEVVGRVVEPASDGTGPPVGTLVVPSTVVGCGSCWWCRRESEGLCELGVIVGLHADGGLADLMLSNASRCVPVPEGVDPAVAAFAEPTAVAVRALAKLPQVAGQRIVVLGAGTVGLLVAQAASAAGAELVIAADPDEARRQLALRSGAHQALNSESDLGGAIQDLTDGLMADAVIECSGADGMPGQAIRLTRRAGTCVLVGLHSHPQTFDLMDTVLGEKRVVGSAAHRWDTDVTTAVALLSSGRVDPRPLVADVIGLSDLVQDGFDRMARGELAGTKLLVRPSMTDTSVPEA